MINLSTDPVPNIRFNVAKTLQSLATQVKRHQLACYFGCCASHLGFTIPPFHHPFTTSKFWYRKCSTFDTLTGFQRRTHMHTHTCTLLQVDAPVVSADIQPCLSSMLADADRDVKYFANRALVTLVAS